MHVPHGGGPGQVNVVTGIADDGLITGFGGSKEWDSGDVELGVSLDEVEDLVRPCQRVRERRHGDCCRLTEEDGGAENEMWWAAHGFPGGKAVS